MSEPIHLDPDQQRRLAMANAAVAIERAFLAERLTFAERVIVLGDALASAARHARRKQGARKRGTSDDA